MGGYVSLPATMAAALLRIPLVIHEQNSILGMGNRVVARFASAIGTSFEETRRLKSDAVMVGNPVRPEIASLQRTPQRRAAAIASFAGDFPFSEDRKTIFIFGGSLGARAINSAMLGGYQQWRGRSDIQVVHVCGPDRLAEVLSRLEEIREPTDRIVWAPFAYLEDPSDAYAIADLAVCRAGATTVAELQVAGVPAILVPWPHALDEDQRLNAEAISSKGGAVLVDDSQVSDLLVAEVNRLVSEPDLLRTMSQAMASLARPDASARLADLVEAQVILKPARTAPEIKGWDPAWRRAHVVGVGGHGVSAIARVLVDMGIIVSGSDASYNPIIDELKEVGVNAVVGHDASLVEEVDVVITSAAVRDSNPELRAAASKKTPILSRAEAMSRLVSDKRLLCVSGTHGKTTTSSMLATVFDDANLDPTWIVGSHLADGRPRGRLGKGEWAILEADEAYGTFLHLHPSIALVTNLEDDHLDHYGTPQGLEAAFTEFMTMATDGVVICADDPRLAPLAGAAARVVTYGFDSRATMRISDLSLTAEGSTFDLVWEEQTIPVRLDVPGRHNALNACGAAAAAVMAGVPIRTAISGLELFKGTGRRFESRGLVSGARLFDDYAHMPAEVEAALTTARLLGPRRLVAVFQPHMVSRTRQFHEEFGEALRIADVVVVTDVDAAREDPDPDVTGMIVVASAFDASPGKKIVYTPELVDAADYVRSEAREGDLFITMGCGTIGALPSMILHEE
jgi:UDP-N-acetylmuramate--alanine ligase